MIQYSSAFCLDPNLLYHAPTMLLSLLPLSEPEWSFRGIVPTSKDAELILNIISSQRLHSATLGNFARKDCSALLLSSQNKISLNVTHKERVGNCPVLSYQKSLLIPSPAAPGGFSCALGRWTEV